MLPPLKIVRPPYWYYWLQEIKNCSWFEVATSDVTSVSNLIKISEPIPRVKKKTGGGTQNRQRTASFRLNFPSRAENRTFFKTPWPESASELYRPIYRRLSAKLVPTFAERSCHVVSVTEPYDRILGFLDRSRYFLFQVAPQLWSRGWVDPVRDPLLLRKIWWRRESKPGPLDL
jgi:hypothetical protein